MSSQPIYNIFRTAPRWHLTELGEDTLEDIRTVASLGGDIHWDNDGVVRKLPNGIVVDVIESYDFWAKEPEKLKVDMPKDVGVFFWGDTVAIHRRPPSL